MTGTDVQTQSLNELKKDIAHLHEVSEDGWVLKWGESPETAFEIVCRKVNKLQVEKLEALLNKGHAKALVELK